MGVAGLWEVLRPAGQVRSLTQLAVEDGFNANPPHQRGFRIGIDASIWFFHATYGREGENPELRTLFFRCCRLLQSPLLPLFVFDGPNRPAIKRGKRVGGNAHWLTQGMKNIIEAFGFEWRVAPGEAEAELAYLNRIGVIDAVLSDDVDNFLFGATMVIRNPSSTLSSNRAHPVKNAQGKDDGNHVVVYTADAILSNPSVALSRSGTILIGLLSGGDYIPAGLPGCGQKFAAGLARAGFGDSLLKAVKELKGARLDAFLDQWRLDIRNELKTNKNGFLPTKKPSLAASLPDDFPSLPVLMSYADPVTSENSPRSNPMASSIFWRNDPDPMRIASICELYFEWGVKDIIVHRFRTVLWPGMVCRAVRRVVADDDALRHPSRKTHVIGSEEDDVTTSPSSPTKQLSSTFSSITLSSPPKKISTTASSSGIAESFTLTSLVTLTSHPESSPSYVPSSSSSPLLLEVVSQRTHTSTDSILEYRVVVDPITLVERAESGVKGIRPPLVGGLFGIDPEEENDGSAIDQDEGYSDDGGGIERLETAASAASKSKTRKADRVIPTAPLRLWLPACMVRAAAPALVAAFEEKVRVREEKKAKRGTKAGRGRRAGTGVKSLRSKDDTSENADESRHHPFTSKVATGQRIKVVRVGEGRRRRKPKQAAEAQNDEYEFIDLSAGESPCSSDREGANVDIKGKAKEKEKTVQAKGIKPTTKRKEAEKASRKATTYTMNEYFNTSKPSTMRTTTRKTPIPRPPVSIAPALNPNVSRDLHEEDFVDIHPLPKSSRPLDLLRAKRQVGTMASNSIVMSKLKSTSVPRYEEEESSSNSSPTRLSDSRSILSGLPSRPAQVVPRPKKKPLFVDLSDTGSDPEVSDVRRPVSGSTIDDSQDIVKGVVRESVGIGELGARVPVSPTPMARSASKLARVVLPPSSPLESEGEGSEGDELPTFHRIPAQQKVTKQAEIVRSVPKPFPMQLVLDSPVSPPSRLRESSKLERTDKNDYGDAVEIVDVFTTPRGPSPPRSPTPSPLPVKPGLAYASSGLITFAKAKSGGFPTSPTKYVSQAEIVPQRKTKLRHPASSEEDVPASGNERNDIHKSPRKSAAHSSPRHILRGDRRAPSPTPFSLPKPAFTSNTTGDVEGCNASDTRLLLEDAGRREGVGWKPRLSDSSAIFISSGSEDEDDATHTPNDIRDVEVAEGSDTCTDQDADTWADTGMILSAPPSPIAHASGDLVSLLPIAAEPPNPPRTSKFKPAPAVTSKVDVHTLSRDRRTSKSLSIQEVVGDEDTLTSRSDPMGHALAPLLVARAKRSMGKDQNVIDLTSD